MVKSLKVIFVLFLSFSAIADSASLLPTDDSYVMEFDPAYNFGSETKFVVGYQYGWVNALMKFDLSPYSGATINDAYIRLYVFSHGGAFPTDEIRITMNNADWDESTVTWNNKPGFNGRIDLVAPGINGWWDIYVTDWVQAIVDGTEPDYGFQVYKGDTDNDYFFIYSKESSTNRPRLEIDFSSSDLQPATLGSIKRMFD